MSNNLKINSQQLKGLLEIQLPKLWDSVTKIVWFGISSLKGTWTDYELKVIWISMEIHPPSLPEVQNMLEFLILTRNYKLLWAVQ